MANRVIKYIDKCKQTCALRPGNKPAQTHNSSDSTPAPLTFLRIPFFFSSASCWSSGICRKSSSQQMKLTVHPIRATPGRTRPSPFNTPPAGVCLLLSLPQSAADDFIPLTQASCARSGSGIAASASRALEVCGAGAHTGSPQTAHFLRRLSPCLSACLPFYHSHTFAVMILRLVFQAVTQTERGQIGVKVTRPQGQK